MYETRDVQSSKTAIVTPSLVQETSFFFGWTKALIGAAVGGSLQLVTLSPGLWELFLSNTFVFSGTTDHSKSAAFSFSNSLSTTIISLYRYINLSHLQNKDKIIFLLDHNLLLTTTYGNTIAGDSMFISGSIIANRLR